jgi:Histidine kinase-, DNA gyrase B-, and HSP90-like ATPase
MRKFDTTPKPAFLLAMRNQRWTVQGALSELVDNGFGPGRGNASRVDIIHDTTNRIITVLDDGQGMESIGRLFQLGNTIGRCPGDIGLYGSGGTMAVLWLASVVDVWSLKNGFVSHDAVDWPDQINRDTYPEISVDWEMATPATTPAPLLSLGHGTMIRIKLSRERTLIPSNIRRDLFKTYAPALRIGKKLVWTTVTKGKTQEEITLTDPLILPDDPARQIKFDLTLEVRGEHLSVFGSIGMIDDLPLSQSFVSVGYGARVITKTRDCYSSPDGSLKFDGTGIAGWIQLGDGWQPYLSTTKDAVNDQPVWDALMGHIFTQIRPLLEKVQEDVFDLTFSDIAVNLEQAFNAQSKANIEVHYAKESPPGDLPGTGGRGDDENEPKASARDPGDDTPKESPAICRVKIYRQSDDQMKGVLCRAVIMSDAHSQDFGVEVNQDHPSMQEAMKQRPINRMALLAWIVAEIGKELPFHPELLRRVVPKRMLDNILGENDREQGRIVTRLLIDRACKPKKAAA